MLKILILISLLLQGCIMPPPPPPPTLLRGNGLLKVIHAPPSPLGYRDLYTDNKEFYQYVNDYNWYVNYVFVHGIMLNNYAETRGWIPPPESPVCKLAVREAMDPLPEFKSSVNQREDPTGFEWELVNYIKVLKKYYIKKIETEEAIAVIQKRLCIY